MDTKPLPLVVFAILLGMPPAADACSLDGFDQDQPPAVIDKSPETDRTYFKWGSDVDPWQSSVRGWHYIRNLKQRDLSLYWKGPDLLIPFDRPLPPDGIACKKDYGDNGSYVLDYHAPIKTSNDGDKPAAAYVQGQKQSSLTGSAIETIYRGSDGNLINASASVILKYFSADRVLQLSIEADPGSAQIGLGLKAFGVDEATATNVLKGKGSENPEFVQLSRFVFGNELEAFDASANENIVLVDGATNKGAINFTQVTSPPTGTASLLLIDSSGALIAATKINLDPLSGQGSNKN